MFQISQITDISNAHFMSHKLEIYQQQKNIVNLKHDTPFRVG